MVPRTATDSRTPYSPDSDRARATRGLRRVGQTVALWLGVAAGSLALLGVLGKVTGVHLAGPEDARAALTTEVDTTMGRLDRLTVRVDGLTVQLRDLQEGQRFTLYLQCVQMKRSDPAAVPSHCDDYPAPARPK